MGTLQTETSEKFESAFFIQPLK